MTGENPSRPAGGKNDSSPAATGGRAAAQREVKRPPSGRGKTDPARTEAPRKIAAALSRKPTAKMAREMLAVELRRLRAMFVEISGRYTANMEARIAELIKTAEDRRVSAAGVSDLLQMVRAPNVKPQKGRRKDLARIEKTVRAAGKTLGE